MVYLNAFITELANSNLDKRMSKCTKLLKNQYLWFYLIFLMFFHFLQNKTLKYTQMNSNKLNE